MREDFPRCQLRGEIQQRLAETIPLLGGGRDVGVGDDGRHVQAEGGDHLRVQVALAVVVAPRLAVVRRVELDLVHVQQGALHGLVQAQLQGRVSEGARTPDHLERLVIGRLQLGREAIRSLDVADGVVGACIRLLAHSRPRALPPEPRLLLQRQGVAPEHEGDGGGPARGQQPEALPGASCSGASTRAQLQRQRGRHAVAQGRDAD
mmetsp:Transcript_15460/g.54168  ORF Transcript_15460/g.54168 Transcript_15460/m.54168 type:complete len:206 (-) Transcript_15460:343-960(-)